MEVVSKFANDSDNIFVILGDEAILAFHFVVKSIIDHGHRPGQGYPPLGSAVIRIQLERS